MPTNNNKENRLDGRSGKYDILFKFGIAFIAILITIIASEYALRAIGKIPGYIPAYGLIPVEKMRVLEPVEFITDEEGVFKANLNYNWPDDHQINSEGFRSIEFKFYETEKKKILFLGDSFTWGSGASPITESFVDIISRKDYVTFNTGIPGTGPMQYAFLAEKYVPLMKPDIIVIMFCMRNDFDYPHPMLPYSNLWHITNAGWLYARDDDGNYLTAVDAYKQHYTKIYGEKNKIQDLFYKSVIGTYFYITVSKVKDKFSGIYHQTDMKDNQRLIREALMKIQKLAHANGAELMVYIIPWKPKLFNNRGSGIESNYHVFKDIDLYIPDFLTKDDYQPDGHFNNAGNHKYAQFILEGLAKRTK